METTRVRGPLSPRCLLALLLFLPLALSAQTVAVSPDGLVVAAASADNVALRDLATGKVVATLKGHTKAVNAVAFLPGGRLVTGSADRTLRIWDLVAGRTSAVLKGHTDEVACLAVSADGRTLLSGSADKTLRVWDVAQGQSTAVLSGHGNLVASVAVSPDGRTWVSGSRDSTIKIWDAATGKVRATIGELGMTYSLAFLPDSTSFLAMSSGLIRQWDARTGLMLTATAVRLNDDHALALSPDHTILASTGDCAALVLRNLGTRKILRQFEGPERYEWYGLAWSPDSRVLAERNENGTVVLWEAATGNQLWVKKEGQP